MKNAVKILALTSMSLFMSCTINKQAEAVRTVSASGSGSVLVVPDTAEIDFTVTTTGWSAKQISNDNDTITAKFINGVIQNGVNENDITKSDVVISNPGSSYEAKRTIKVISRNTALVPAIIDAKNPSIKLKAVAYSLSDTSSDVRRARTSAIQNAQDAASLLAGASGSKIGSVYSISGEKVTQTEEAGGKIKIQSDVTVTYEIN